MLSDESSSDSETGRFKCRSEKERKQPVNLKRNDNFRSIDRTINSDTDRYRDKDYRRHKKDDYNRHSRDVYSHSTHSSSNRRRFSRDRCTQRRSKERYRYNRDLRSLSRTKEHRSSSRDRRRHSRSRSYRSSSKKRTYKEGTVKEKAKVIEKGFVIDKKSIEISLSPEQNKKRSEVYKPSCLEKHKKNRESPIRIEETKDSDKSEEVQEGSYYNMIPAVVLEKPEYSSEIDSSDDEGLRAKLLNLEKELHRTRKKKSKKHKKKCTKSSRDVDQETSVEVTSTTDVQQCNEISYKTSQESAEVTSTQKSSQKESSEEGEILSEDDNIKNQINIDPTDLRHKLKRSVPNIVKSLSPDLRERIKSKADICGPVLPPTMGNTHSRSLSPNCEGPALPPHLIKKKHDIGPYIPENLRRVFADKEHEVIKYISSDEEVGMGPLPVGAEDKWSDAHQLLEMRALDMKLKKIDGHTLHNRNVKNREQWMLELPEGKARYLGLEARTFRAKEGPDMSDRSSWTDTPEQKARKAAGPVTEDPEVILQREARSRQIAYRDEEQEREVKKHKKKHKRDESLLDMHQKKLKKKKKKDDKEDGKKERRTFSREIDLQVNRFDEAQKKSIIKKAQELNTRFSSGEAKFL